MDVRIQRTFLIGILSYCLLPPLALAGNDEDYELGIEYFNNQELAEATVIFKKLALQNYLPAQARLGDLIDSAELHEMAVGWYIMAAFQGEASGAFGLGRAYAYGSGINKDPAQALYWIKFAADKENLDAMRMIEQAYRMGEASGLAVQVDLKQAEYWNAKRTPLEKARIKELKAKQQAVLKKIYDEKQELKKEIQEAEKARKSR